MGIQLPLIGYHAEKRASAKKNADMEIRRFAQVATLSYWNRTSYSYIPPRNEFRPGESLLQKLEPETVVTERPVLWMLLNELADTRGSLVIPDERSLNLGDKNRKKEESDKKCLLFILEKRIEIIPLKFKDEDVLGLTCSDPITTAWHNAMALQIRIENVAGALR